MKKHRRRTSNFFVDIVDYEIPIVRIFFIAVAVMAIGIGTIVYLIG